MKKIFIFIILFLLPINVYSSILPLNPSISYRDISGTWVGAADGSSVRISRISSLVSKVTSPSLSLKSAANIFVKNSEGALVNRSLAMNIGKSVGSGLIGAIALGGVMYLGESYVDWLIGQGDELVKMDNKIKVQNKMNDPNFTSQFNSQYPGVQFIDGNFTTCNDMPATWSCPEGATPSWFACGDVGSIGSAVIHSATPICSFPNYTYQVAGDAVYWGTNVPQVPTNPATYRNATEQEIENVAESAYDNDPNGWYDAVNHTLRGLNNALVNYDDDMNLPNSGVYVPKMCSILAQAFDTNVLDQMSTALADPFGEGQMTPEDLINNEVINSPVSVDMTETNSGLASINSNLSNIADVNNTNLNNINNNLNSLNSKIGNDVSVPTETLPTAPTKLSLTSVMTSFMNSINNLPLLQTLRGLTINCSGTSVLCIGLPSAYGGNQCVDFGSSTSTLNGIGTALLSITSVFMFAWVFKA